jgi:transcriptional regulator with XRE-family HTH domain
MSKLSTYLDHEYLNWQQAQGGSRPLQEFAEYLEVDRPTLSVWMRPDSKRVPDERNLAKLSCKLGLEIYDVLGKERPDPRLLFITHNWPKISEEGKKRITNEANRFTVEKDNKSPST